MGQNTARNLSVNVIRSRNFPLPLSFYASPLTRTLFSCKNVHTGFCVAVDCLSSTIQKAGPSHNKRGKKKARSAKIQSHGWLGTTDIMCMCVSVSVSVCMCVLLENHTLGWQTWHSGFEMQHCFRLWPLKGQLSLNTIYGEKKKTTLLFYVLVGKNPNSLQRFHGQSHIIWDNIQEIKMWLKVCAFVFVVPF